MASAAGLSAQMANLFEMRGFAAGSCCALRRMGDGKCSILPQEHSRSPVRDGAFVLHGLDSDSEIAVPAFFLDPERKLGARTTVQFSGRSNVDGAAAVRLEPCGTARARLVTSDNKPLDRYDARALAVLGSDPGPLQTRRGKNGPLFADEASVVSLDPVNYGSDFQSDAQGRLTLPALIPARPIIQDFTPAFGGGDPAIRKEFTVKVPERPSIWATSSSPNPAREFVMNHADARDLVNLMANAVVEG